MTIAAWFDTSISIELCMVVMGFSMMVAYVFYLKWSSETPAYKELDEE